MDYDKDCNLEFDIFINIRMEQQRQQKGIPQTRVQLINVC